MPKLARVLAIGALLTAMSLADTAHAQDGDDQPQQAGVTQQDPTPEQPAPPDPGTSEDPGTPQDPGTPETPGTPPETPGTPESPGAGSTTTARPPVVRPKSLPVTVSPRAGSSGTTVKVTADLRGCTRPNGAEGFFQEVHEWDVDGLNRPLVWERVTGGRWYSAQFLVTQRDPVGLGRFGVICDNGQPNFIDGYATFMVKQASSSPVKVRATPRAGGPGTTVRITADLPECDKLQMDLYDSKGRKSKGTVKGLALEGRRLTGRYTVSSRDPVGQMRSVVTCFLGHDPVYHGSASFRVLAATGGGSGGNDQIANGNDRTQLANRIDTGQGGTANGPSQDGLDPTLLLPVAGLLLIAVAGGLWLRQTTAGRRV